MTYIFIYYSFVGKHSFWPSPRYPSRHTQLSQDMQLYNSSAVFYRNSFECNFLYVRKSAMDCELYDICKMNCENCDCDEFQILNLGRSRRVRSTDFICFNLLLTLYQLVKSMIILSALSSHKRYSDRKKKQNFRFKSFIVIDS